MNQPRHQPDRISNLAVQSEHALLRSAATSRDSSTRLAEFEELVLLSIAGLRDQAYGTAIWHKLQQAGRTVTTASVYVALSRLEAKEFIVSEQGEATAERGGRAKTYYALTAVGQGALENAEEVRSRLRAAVVESVSLSVPLSVPQPMSEDSEQRLVVPPHRINQSAPPVDTLVPVPPVQVRPAKGKSPSPPPSRPEYLNYYGS